MLRSRLFRVLAMLAGMVSIIYIMPSLYLPSSRRGLKVTAFEIARIDVDKPALLQRKKMDLRREARGVAGRVAIFAIDGADWELLSELADDGNLPNLKALSRGGTTGSTQTIEP